MYIFLKKKSIQRRVEFIRSSVIVSFIILVKRSKCEEKYDCAFYGEILFRYLIFFCYISKPLMFESKLTMVGYTG